jgi:hypothetical protein
VTIVVVFKFNAAPDVPTLTSTTPVSSLSVILAQLAVPSVSADESSVIAEKVNTPPEVVPQGSEQVNVANKVQPAADADGVAGRPEPVV